MRYRRFLLPAFAFALLLGLTAAPAAAQTTSFSYQGQLTDDSGTPLNETVDLTFTLYDAASGGNQIGSTITKSDVSIDNGAFTVSLDFGTASFAGGAERWLEIEVDDGSGAETLSPRTKLEAASTALSMPSVTVDASGRVGISETSPIAQLDISSNSLPIFVSTDGTSNHGVYSYLSNSNNTGAGVLALNGGTGPALHGWASGSGEAGRFRGGNVSVLDGSGNSELVFRTNQTNNAGQLSMFASNGTETFEILADELGNDGAQAILRQDDGTTSITIDGELGDGGGADIGLRNGGGTRTLRMQANEGNTSGGSAIKLFNGGTSSEQTIELDGNRGSGDGGWIDVANGDGTPTLSLRGDEGSASGGGTIKLYNASASSPTIELDADFGGGGGNVGRITTDEMELNGSDVAEHFDVRAVGEAVPEAGRVVCIDPSRPGKLVVCEEAHDRTVAGVISGAGGIRPGIHMGQEGTVADGDRPVAVAGRVYVQADASGGAIQPGDLLTTADAPGLAMKATNHEKARGAILGKAMTGLKKGTGLVLVLVSLQ